MTQEQQVQRFNINNGPPLWGQRGLIVSLVLDNLSDYRKRPMVIPARFRRWVSFDLSTEDYSRNPIFDAIVKGIARDDVYDEVLWHITGEGVFLQTIKDIMNDGVRENTREGPPLKFKAEYNVRDRKGSMEISVPG
ncbi:MAG: hypothetical protein ABH813_02125 [Patescibacteria group bacterium]